MLILKRSVWKKAIASQIKKHLGVSFYTFNSKVLYALIQEKLFNEFRIFVCLLCFPWLKPYFALNAGLKTTLRKK